MEKIKHKLRIYNGLRVKVQFQLEIRDLWIGAFWRLTPPLGLGMRLLHIFICFVPCIPLHFTILLGGPGGAIQEPKEPEQDQGFECSFEEAENGQE